MSDAYSSSGRRVVALVTLVAAAILLVHGMRWDAVRFQDGHFIAHPAAIVTIGAHKASLFRIACVADMLNYLLVIPAVAYLWMSLRTRGAWFVDVESLAGL